jgi:SH3-like domain-containing protein
MVKQRTKGGRVMARLSKTEKYAIQWLAHQGWNSVEISQELKLSEQSICNCLEKTQPINDQTVVNTKSTPVVAKPKSLIINETAAKKTKSVSIMTEAASQQADAARKFVTGRNNDKNIYRPNNG